MVKQYKLNIQGLKYDTLSIHSILSQITCPNIKNIL